METFKELNLFTKIALPAGLLLIIYGYACRLLGLYFFGESRSVGWIVIIIGVIGLLWHRAKTKRSEQQKAIPEKIGMWILIFILFAQSVLMIVIPFTDAYTAAKKYLVNDKDLTSEIGTVTGFGLIPVGSIQIKTDASGKSGNAVINLTVKGDEKFKDLIIYVVKDANSDEWKVEEIE